MEELPIRVQIADRSYNLFVEPEAEAVVRQAAKLIQDDLKKYREMGFKETQEALAMIAFDCLVNKLRGEKQMQRLQQMVFDKITQLDEAITPAIST
ncbi:hypothetical protein GCM10027592_13940 [Spirosoma flavus]